MLLRSAEVKRLFYRFVQLLLDSSSLSYYALTLGVAHLDLCSCQRLALESGTVAPYGALQYTGRPSVARATEVTNVGSAMFD